MTETEKILMRRDGLTKEEAHRRLEDARDVLEMYLEDDDYEDAYYVMEEEFGLEPDYLMDILF